MKDKETDKYVKMTNLDNMLKIQFLKTQYEAFKLEFINNFDNKYIEDDHDFKRKKDEITKNILQYYQNPYIIDFLCDVLSDVCYENNVEDMKKIALKAKACINKMELLIASEL